MSLLIKKQYYVIETPTITDSIYINTYSYDNIKKQKSNDSSDGNYDRSHNTIYYDHIVKYEPTPSINNYQGINPSLSKESYSKKGPYDIFDLSKYISNRLVNLIDQLQLLNKCNKYRSSNESIPASCQDVFIGYDTKANINDQIDKKIIPLYKDYFLTKYKKHLQQQVNDIKNLIDRFNIIVESIKNDNSIPSGDYEKLLRTNRDNVKIRSELDLKLGEIYEYNSSNIVKSRVNLDSTVYTGVIWSILATSLAYFVFTKL